LSGASTFKALTVAIPDAIPFRAQLPPSPKPAAFFRPTCVALSLCEIERFGFGVSTRLHRVFDWYTRVHT
jgi:hypothetical protein